MRPGPCKGRISEVKRLTSDEELEKCWVHDRNYEEGFFLTNFKSFIKVSSEKLMTLTLAHDLKMCWRYLKTGRAGVSGVMTWMAGV